ncbi:unnamed protein product [Gongylonema pulchrum]|uniref:PEHE domain-containing protein n=1 Tax=Gongylonema pulchrum TaxID=637853 RepID=A0A183E9D5_9BILA|nr:unnamed protein product [Gongylonema pulchrum]
MEAYRPLEERRTGIRKLSSGKKQHSTDTSTDEFSTHKQRYGSRSKSISVIEVNKREPEENNEISERMERVVYWPPLPKKQERERARSVPPSVKARSITDPERLDEYRRQKELELEAMRRHEEEAMLYRKKQESPQPQFMRVYETRPITAMSESSDPREVVFSPNSATWKRVYIVDRPKPVAKNEIITSEQLLEKERFNIDLLKVVNFCFCFG